MGLALSGGGIRMPRSAWGFLQSLARKRACCAGSIFFPRSPGAAISRGFLGGGFYDRLRITPKLASDIVETAVANSNSSQIHNLRTHAQYIAPSGKADLQEGFGVFLRNFLTLHFVIGTLIFGLYGLANGQVALRGLEPDQRGASVFWCIPLEAKCLSDASWWRPICTYSGALVCPGRADAASLCAAKSHQLLALFAGRHGGLQPAGAADDVYPAVVAAVADGARRPEPAGIFPGRAGDPHFVSAARVDMETECKRNQTLGTGGESIQRLRARTYLSRELGLWLALTGMFLYLALIDTAGHAIYEAYSQRNISYIVALGQLGGGRRWALLPILTRRRRLWRPTSSPKSRILHSGRDWWAGLP